MFIKILSNLCHHACIMLNEINEKTINNEVKIKCKLTSFTQYFIVNLFVF